MPKNLTEEIVRLINHGLDNIEIAGALTETIRTFPEQIIACIRDLVDDKATNRVIERAINYTKLSGCCGSDCDLKNAVHDYLEAKKLPPIPVEE